MTPFFDQASPANPASGLLVTDGKEAKAAVVARRGRTALPTTSDLARQPVAPYGTQVPRTVS